MRNRLYVTTGVAVLVAAAVYAQAGRSDDDAAIRKHIDQFSVSFNKADAKSVAQLFTDDGDYLSSTGQRGEGRAGIEKTLAAQFAGGYKGGTTKTAVTSIRYLKPDVAIVNGSFEISGLQANGKALPVRKGLVTSVLVKQGDKWLFAALRGMVPAPVTQHATS